MATWSDAFSGQSAHTLELVLTEDSTNITNNSSSVTATLRINPPSNSTSWNNYGDASYSMEFEGQTYSGNFSYDFRTNRSTKTLVSKTKNVGHFSDGSGYAEAKGSANAGSGTLGSASIGYKSIDLQTFNLVPSIPSAGPTLTRGTSGTSATIVSATATSSSTITRYEYQQSTTTSFIGLTAELLATPPAATSLSGLTATQAYYYQTRAVNASGNGPWAQTATLPPAQPTALTATAVTTTSVALDWNGPLTSLERYKVEYKRATDSTWVNTGYTGTTSEYTVAGLSENTIYDFRVLAENPTYVRSSGYATLSSATLPPAPTNLYVTSFTATSVSLRWDPNGQTNKLEYKTSDSATWLPATQQLGMFTYTRGALFANTTYNFRVSVVNSSNSTQSDFATITQTTLPAGPPVRTGSTTWSPSQVYVRTDSGTPAWTLGSMYVWDGIEWKVVG